MEQPVPHRLGVFAALAFALLACGAREQPVPVPAPEPVVEAPVPAPAPEPTAKAPAPMPAPEPAPAPAPVPVPKPAPPATAPAPAPPAPTPPAPAAEPAPAPLDLESLKKRLRDTSAIGFFTKLALKGDIDDLLAALRAYHEREEGRLPVLRERFELLVMKTVSLLQDDDPGLADALVRSREALWALLADPVRFAKVAS